MTSKRFQPRNFFGRSARARLSQWAICLLTGATVLLGAVDSAHGWFWWRLDMRNQPSVRAQEGPRPLPPNSISIQGKEARMDRVEAGKKLRNPIEPNPGAVERGKKLYGIYCSPCHGTNAKGGGPVAAKFVPPPDLTLDVFRHRPDGFLYETIADGGPLMPEQGDALRPRERWEIVLYLRQLQGAEK